MGSFEMKLFSCQIQLAGEGQVLRHALLILLLSSPELSGTEVYGPPAAEVILHLIVFGHSRLECSDTKVKAR